MTVESSGPATGNASPRPAQTPALSGSIPALVTPFKEDKVDWGALEALVEWHIAEGTHGVAPVGTTGESPTVSHEEHEAVVAFVVRQAAGRLPVVAGAGSNNTVEAIRFARHAADIGADAALSVAPYYNRPTQEGLYRHFEAIHAAAEIPLVLYNVPARTSSDIAVETVARLSKLDRVIALKDASADLSRPALTQRAAAPGFIQLSGEDATAVAFNAVGGVGCISVTANVAPRLCSEMQAATLRGDFAAAQAINLTLAPLHEALFCEPSPGPAKYALSLLGKCMETTRSPLAPLTDEARAQVRAAMEAADLL